MIKSLFISNGNNRRAVKYLNKDCHVGYSIVNHLIENKLLFQEKRTNNAVFTVYDENNNIVGVELHGTIQDRLYINIKMCSKYSYGFNVRFSNDDTFDYALFFESAIDLISFIDYKFNHDKKSLERCILVSMAGLKENVLCHTLKAFKGDLKAVLCVDNDEAGQAFKNRIRDKKIPFKICSPDKQFKDWNEQITSLRNTKKVITRLLERNSIKG